MRKQSRVLIALVFSVTACTEEPEAVPVCTDVTRYQGPTVTCSFGWPTPDVPGYCVSHFGAPPECAATCNDCLPDHWPQTIAVSDGPPICYCYPKPTAHVIGDSWRGETTDHR